MPQTNKHALIALNPAAGNGSALDADDVLAAARADLGSFQVLHTSFNDEHVVRTVAEHVQNSDRLDLVIVVGGDGTARSVAEGLARGLGRWPAGRRGGSGGKRTPALLLLPGGSGNSAFRALWGETTWYDAFSAGLRGDGGPARALDLVRIVEHERASFLGVNTGLVASVARHVEEAKAGEAASGDTADEASERYWTALERALHTFAPFPARMVADGRVLHEGETTLATIGGVQSFGRGAFQLLPHARLDDELLDACAIRALNGERLIELAPLVLSGEHVRRPEVAYTQCARVRLERMDGQPLDAEHDGDPFETRSSLTLEVIPGAVHALVGSEDEAA